MSQQHVALGSLAELAKSVWVQWQQGGLGASLVIPRLPFLVVVSPAG